MSCWGREPKTPAPDQTGVFPCARVAYNGGMVENPSDSRKGQSIEATLFSGFWADERGLLMAVEVVAVVYPVMLHVGLYGAWLIAYGKLGHAPRTSWDDPKELLGVINLVCGLPVLLMGAGVTAAGFSVLRRFYSVLTGRSRPCALVIALVICALWIGSFALLRWDPIGVGEWWID